VRIARLDKAGQHILAPWIRSRLTALRRCRLYRTVAPHGVGPLYIMTDGRCAAQLLFLYNKLLAQKECILHRKVYIS
jgi:hypothetical protein